MHGIKLENGQMNKGWTNGEMGSDNEEMSGVVYGIRMEDG